MLLWLMVLVLGATHAAAAPSALCRHATIEAHEAARVSADADVANQAHQEEASRAAVEKLGSLSDTLATSMASVVLPSRAVYFGPPELSSAAWGIAQPEGLSGRAEAPLLQPPLA